MHRRTSRGSSTTSWPRTRAEPEVGIRSVISILIVVVFPAPFGPSKPKSSPSPTSKLTPRTASTSFERRRSTPVVVRYVRCRPSASITATHETLVPLTAGPFSLENGCDERLRRLRGGRRRAARQRRHRARAHDDRLVGQLRAARPARDPLRARPVAAAPARRPPGGALRRRRRGHAPRRRRDAR